MSSQQNRTPAYIKEIQDSGLNVTMYEARRFRAMLTHFADFKAYLLKKLNPVEVQWMHKIVAGSPRFQEIKDGGSSDEEATIRAAKYLRDILQNDDFSEKEKAETVSQWLLDWASEDGIVKLRTVINGQVSSRRRGRSPIAVSQPTRDRFNTIMSQTDAGSADEMMNLMLDAYEKMYNPKG